MKTILSVLLLTAFFMNNSSAIEFEKAEGVIEFSNPKTKGTEKNLITCTNKDNKEILKLTDDKYLVNSKLKCNAVDVTEMGTKRYTFPCFSAEDPFYFDNEVSDEHFTDILGPIFKTILFKFNGYGGVKKELNVMEYRKLSIGSVFKSTFQKEDIFCQMGDEGFVVFLKEYADKFRQKISVEQWKELEKDKIFTSAFNKMRNCFLSDKIYNCLPEFIMNRDVDWRKGICETEDLLLSADKDGGQGVDVSKKMQCYQKNLLQENYKDCFSNPWESLKGKVLLINGYYGIGKIALQNNSKKECCLILADKKLYFENPGPCLIYEGD